MQIPVTYILGKTNDKDIQIPYTEFVSTFVNYVPSPDSTITPGQQGYISADDWDDSLGNPDLKSSGYIYANNAWRKIPTYTANWDDLDPVKNDDGSVTYIRFLPIHKQITLTSEELQRVRGTLDLGIAAQNKEGLVKINQIPSTYQSYLQVDFEGYAYINPATNNYPGVVTTVGSGIQVYTKDEIDKKFTSAGGFAIPVAQETQIGGILNNSTDITIDSTGRVSVNKASVQQETPTYGTVRYAPNRYIENIDEPDTVIDDETTYTLNAYQIKEVINHYIEKNKPIFNLNQATDTKLGGVKVDSINTNILISSDGLIDVKSADKDTKGVVLVTDDIDGATDATSLTVPTAYAVKKEFEQLQNIQVKATTTQLGSVIVGQGLQVDENGKISANISLASHTNNQPGIVYTTNSIKQNLQYVPTSQAVFKFVTDSINNLDVSDDIPFASDNTPGLVYVNPAINQDKTSARSYTVPTIQKVQEMIDGQSTQTTISVDTIESEQWLIVGTGYIDRSRFLASAASLDIEVIKLIAGYSQDDVLLPSVPIIQLGAIVVFGSSINKDQIYTILQSMVIESGATYSDCVNNFILIPGSTVFGNYLSSVS